MLFALFTLATAVAAVPSLVPTEAPSFVTPSATLTYTVESGGDTRSLVVTLKSLEGDLVFDWTMGEMSGTRTITAADRASARAQDNYFANGESTSNGTSTVFLSVDQMTEIAGSGKTAAVIDGREVTLKYKGTEMVDVPIGEGTDPMMVWNLVGKGAKITVFANPKFPVILEQDVGFHVKIDRIN